MNRNDPPIGKGRPPGRTVWICLVAAGAAATMASYLLLDLPVTGSLLRHPNAWHTDRWIDGFRQLGKATVPIWLLLIWSCLTDRWRSTAVTVAALILVGVSVCPLKAIVGRSRPNALVSASPSSGPQSPSVRRLERVSFPSGDTAVVFAAATTLSAGLGRLWAPLLFMAAGAVGLLRVTALAHYPSDVWAGALLGVLCGGCALKWMARLTPLDRFHIRRRWRLAATLTVILVVPIPVPLLNVKPLQIFLDAYAVPLVAFALVYLGAVWLRASRPLAHRLGGSPTPDAAMSNGNGLGVPNAKSCVGEPLPSPESHAWEPSPIAKLRAWGPDPKPGSLEEPTS